MDREFMDVHASELQVSVGRAADLRLNEASIQPVQSKVLLARRRKPQVHDHVINMARCKCSHLSA